MAGPGYNDWGLWTYTSDDGINYNLRIGTEKATVAGFTAGTGSQGKWGKISRNNRPRGVWYGGVFPDDNKPVRYFLYAPTEAAMKSLFQGGAQNIIVSGVTISLTPTGYEGERRSMGQYGSGS